MSIQTSPYQLFDRKCRPAVVLKGARDVKSVRLKRVDNIRRALVDDARRKQRRFIVHEPPDIGRHADYYISHDICAHHVIFPRCHAGKKIRLPDSDICAAVLRRIFGSDLDRNRVDVIRAAVCSAEL